MPMTPRTQPITQRLRRKSSARSETRRLSSLGALRASIPWRAIPTLKSAEATSAAARPTQNTPHTYHGALLKKVLGHPHALFMGSRQGGRMTTTPIISVNALLAVLVIVAVGTLVRLAHRLPEQAPHHDEQWGTGGDPWVPSDPLPLHQVARHEAERALALAA